MPDVAAGVGEAAPGMNEHLRACPACFNKLEEMRKTIALLDEWTAPEPSPYFDTRLLARLREEMAKPQPGWLQRFRAPALALSFALLMMVVGGVSWYGRTPEAPPLAQIPAAPGTAVGDLQALDKNHDLYADFDILDDLQVQQDVQGNP
jgi:anti-sigma factor RsiW